MEPLPAGFLTTSTAPDELKKAQKLLAAYKRMNVNSRKKVDQGNSSEYRVPFLSKFALAQSLVQMGIEKASKRRLLFVSGLSKVRSSVCTLGISSLIEM